MDEEDPRLPFKSNVPPSEDGDINEDDPTTLETCSSAPVPQESKLPQLDLWLQPATNYTSMLSPEAGCSSTAACELVRYSDVFNVLSNVELLPATTAAAASAAPPESCKTTPHSCSSSSTFFPYISRRGGSHRIGVGRNGGGGGGGYGGSRISSSYLRWMRGGERRREWLSKRNSAATDTERCGGESPTKRICDEQKHRRGRSAELHNMSEKIRRERIKRKMKTLKELLPTCDKADQASIIDAAIKYIKSLQQQVQEHQMVSVGVGAVFQAPYMPQPAPAAYQGVQIPFALPFFQGRPMQAALSAGSGMTVGMGIGMGVGISVPSSHAIPTTQPLQFPCHNTSPQLLSGSGGVPMPQLQLPLMNPLQRFPSRTSMSETSASFHLPHNSSSQGESSSHDGGSLRTTFNLDDRDRPITGQASTCGGSSARVLPSQLVMPQLSRSNPEVPLIHEDCSETGFTQGDGEGTSKAADTCSDPRPGN